MKEYRLKDLFVHRGIWMGFAILWIIIYHSELPVENRLLWMIKNVGYCGVDIFFFASGLGCYHSYRKDPDPLRFMMRRIRRVIPVYWIFLTLLYIYEFFAGTLRPQYILSNYLCIEYFKDAELDTAFNWYMGAIWIMYLLVPLFYSVIAKGGTNSIRFILVLLMISLGFWHSDNLILLGTRIPVFFLGMYYEYLALQDRVLTRRSLLGHLAAFLIGFGVLVPLRLLITDNTIMWGCGLLFYPFLLMTPFMCLALSLFAVRAGGILAPLRTLLETAGRYSFELYLMHHMVFEMGLRLLRGAAFYKTRLFWLMLYACVIPATCLLHILCNAVMSFFPEPGGKAGQAIQSDR